MTISETSVLAIITPKTLTFTELNEKKSFTVSAEWSAGGPPTSGNLFVEGKLTWTSDDGFDGGLEKPPTDALRPIIPDNDCILCLTVAAGIELADVYSPNTVIASLRKEVHDHWEFGLCLSPSVVDHPLGPATDHRLGKLLPHQQGNQKRAPPWVDSPFCSSAYEVLAIISSCCLPREGSYALLTRSPLETPLLV
ncbi:hypothetical protein ZIOFF_031434 [Zingiber officinale]|uniref:Uncharacterized protein n=1 Tax=Zingiber officinale TaxID=94328 RepID=A0A8J5L0A7_ZINOF|nr:hypothetical protein ZIOFF_031434 [Zingiber officinale]